MKNTNSSLTKFFLVLAILVAVINPLQKGYSVPVTGDIVTMNVSQQTVKFDVAYSLHDFVSSVQNGNGSQIVGLYADNVFALRVVQQPSGDAGYVSTSGGTATQFGMASNYGSIGMLAHNYLAGSYFSSLGSGSVINVIYGDGTVDEYTVSSVRKYQALSPTSAYSDFKNLSDPSTTLSVSDVFDETYGQSGALVLQTCISNNGNSSWGRLFVIAFKA